MAEKLNITRRNETQEISPIQKARVELLDRHFGKGNSGLIATGYVVSSHHSPPKLAKSGKCWERVETEISNGDQSFSHLEMKESPENSQGTLSEIPEGSAVRVSFTSANTSQGSNPELMGPIEVLGF